MALTNLLDTCPADKLDAYLFTLCLDTNYAGWQGHAETFDSILWGEVTVPSESVFNSKLVALTAEYDVLAYSRNRKAEYDVLNQFELISDDSINSTTTHKDAIVAVKTKWPKDNSGPV